MIILANTQALALPQAPEYKGTLVFYSLGYFIKKFSHFTKGPSHNEDLNSH